MLPPIVVSMPTVTYPVCVLMLPTTALPAPTVMSPAPIAATLPFKVELAPRTKLPFTISARSDAAPAAFNLTPAPAVKALLKVIVTGFGAAIVNVSPAASVIPPQL